MCIINNNPINAEDVKKVCTALAKAALFIVSTSAGLLRKVIK